MKTLRQMCAIAVLTMVLAISVCAGQMHSPGVVAPPPPPGQTETPPSTDITTTVILTIIGLIP